MSWKVVRLTDKQVSAWDAFRLQGQFEAIFMTALAPRDAAMFGNIHARRDDHLFYFSPRAADIFQILLQGYSAQDCQAPPSDSVVLLVGHADARETLLAGGAAG